jgi:hypothetical protein
MLRLCWIYVWSKLFSFKQTLLLQSNGASSNKLWKQLKKAKTTTSSPAPCAAALHFQQNSRQQPDAREREH